MALLLGAMLMVTTASIDIPTDTLNAAAEAGVDPVDLQGALLTVSQQDARTYLRHSGELPWPVVPSMTRPPGIWDRLAACESSGNWHVNAYHDGGLQFLPSTWTRWKLPGYPAFAYQATREQQIAVAERLQRAAGWEQWPACARRLGLVR